MDATFPDGRLRFHGEDGRDYGSIATLGTFSQRATVSERSVVKIDEWPSTTPAKSSWPPATTGSKTSTKAMPTCAPERSSEG
jgi:S-(hydroxymethyl)glutathione dehydrogenase/alcohol dehydrogenase